MRLSIQLFVVALLLSAIGCDRRPFDYAGIKDRKPGQGMPEYTVEPKIQPLTKTK